MTADDAQYVLEVKRRGGEIWSHVRQTWLVETPEETVRQEYLCVLVNEYAFTLEQIDEELNVTGRGSGGARADFVVWRSAQDKLDQRPPLIIVECKSDNVTISDKDYWQGDRYARLYAAPFLVTHNHRETKYWRVIHDRAPKTLQEIEDIPHADASDTEIQKIISRLKAFREDEFADLLHKCHNVIRNREHKDPAAAFDEIAKILFVKVWVERQMRRRRHRQNVFTAAYLDLQLADNPLDYLFQQTKRHFAADQIFAPEEQINLKPATGREIVWLLESYDLSETSEDVKGIAFERFLGRTFRGEIGQFFTPRTIVEFMVDMVDPKECDIICDPASGSGGFLIRFFEIVRQAILADADREYSRYREEVNARQDIGESQKAQLLRDKFAEIQRTIAPNERGSRLWRLANQCIYGTDANDRMARTSKMNMIMHGDGHGGVHHHNGFLNVNGIFEGRFDIILTNPPFGANVEPSDVVLESEVDVLFETEQHYLEEYGELYREAQARVKAALGKPIASLFELPGGRRPPAPLLPTGSAPKPSLGKIKTEILFIERCLALLKPGGRLGIVLPEGVLNNPSLAYVREFCEDRAFIRAVVSLPQEAFYSSGASVKASLLFMQKFTAAEADAFNAVQAEAMAETRAAYAAQINQEEKRLLAEIAVARRERDAERTKSLTAERRQFLREMADRISTESRALLKERFDYPIFLYEAEKVGITATGEEDENELYPNERVPSNVEKTCLDLHRDFVADPSTFLQMEAH